MDAMVSPLAEGTWYFHVRAADSVGNWSGTTHYGPLRYDRNAPQVSVTINDGTFTTSTTIVQVNISATDIGSGVDSAEVRAASVTKVFPMSSSATIVPWNLFPTGEPFSSERVIVVRVKDRAGNWSGEVPDSIRYVATGVGEVIAGVVQPALTVYPNPVTTGDRIRFFGAGLNSDAPVVVCDPLGREVAHYSLTDQNQVGESGNAQLLATGVYECRVTAHGRTATARLTVVR
jgi:hypothetical protein